MKKLRVTEDVAVNANPSNLLITNFVVGYIPKGTIIQVEEVEDLPYGRVTHNYPPKQFDQYTSNGTYKKGVDPEVTCWHCKQTFLCDCMDATCRLCKAPFSRARCEEFNFTPKQVKREGCGDIHAGGGE